MVSKGVEIYTMLLVIYALLSWFPGAYQTGLGKFLRKICQPYLNLFERFRLSIGPIDFTIAVAIFVLYLANQGLYILIYNLIF